MTLGVILRRSRRIWPANDEILRFTQNDSFAVSFEHLKFESFGVAQDKFWYCFGFRI